MPKKKRRAADKKEYVPSAAQRADDERLRESLRNADLKAFDRLLGKAILPGKPS
jgi:hypothetical protein